jgi:hypothetical protein
LSRSVNRGEPATSLAVGAAMERYRRRESCASALVGAWRRFDLVVQVIQRDSVHFQNCAAGQAEALKLQASPL